MSWYWIGGIAIVVVLALLSRRGEAPGTGGRTTAEPPSPARIDDLLRTGRKIEAIKIYRRLHHVDLKSAKDAIDARARELGR
jgi:ribosomal protein L7/L12